MDVRGKVALVTGAGSGLGEASALRLAEAGADLVLVSRTPDEIEAVAEKVRQKGRKALAIAADVADEVAMADLFQKTQSEFGRLDIVFANAGVNGVWAPIDELQPDEWDSTIRINLRGTFLSLHYAVPLMKQNGGSIIITASINGTRTFTSTGAHAYSTTKAGQVALAQMAALELARYKIRVNVICPGAIESEIDDNTEKRNTEKAEVPAEHPEGTIPLTKGKPGKADDVADLVLFLASDQSRHITGSPIWIDGAQSLLV